MSYRSFITAVTLLFVLIPVGASAEPATPSTKPAGVQTIPVAEFEKRSKEPNTVILDVRTPKEFAEAHLPGAVNIDWKSKDFKEKVQALDKSKTYLVHCAIGGRSRAACEQLGKLDFPQIYNLDGGIMAWQRAGKPTEPGEKK